MSDNDLADKILEWYWSNQDKISKNKRFWAQNPIGYALSTMMKEQKRWKNKARGKQDLKHFTPVNDFDLDF